MQPGGLNCFICDAGKYTNAPGLTQCTSCPEGKSLSDGSDPDLIARNHTLHDNENDCESCTAGRFANSVGSSHCAVCSKGRFSTSEEATNCTACAPGSFIDDDGTLSQYHDEIADCEFCASGKYSNVEGASGPCTDCPTGRFQNDEGVISIDKHDDLNDCTICSAGQYANR